MSECGACTIGTRSSIGVMYDCCAGMSKEIAAACLTLDSVEASSNCRGAAAGWSGVARAEELVFCELGTMLIIFAIIESPVSMDTAFGVLVEFASTSGRAGLELP